MHEPLRSRKINAIAFIPIDSNLHHRAKGSERGFLSFPDLHTLSGNFVPESMAYSGTPGSSQTNRSTVQCGSHLDLGLEVGEGLIYGNVWEYDCDELMALSPILLFRIDACE